MITIEYKIYCYGEYHCTEISEFIDENHLYKYIKIGIEYTETIRNSPSGWVYGQWEEEFTHNGITYRHYIDIIPHIIHKQKQNHENISIRKGRL